MFGRSLAVAMALIVTADIASATEIVDGSNENISQADKAILFRLLDEDLLDASSAQIKDIRFAKQRKYCGFIKAKNAYGAYVGYKMFAVDLTEQLVLFDIDSRQKTDVITSELSFGLGTHVGICGLTKHL
jgi:hypothetical protein